MSLNDAMRGPVARRSFLMRAAGGQAAGDRTAIARLTLCLLVILSAAAIALSIATGASDASAVNVIGALLAGAEDTALSMRDRIIVFDIRMPRALLGFLIGAALAMSAPSCRASSAIRSPIPASSASPRARRSARC